MATGWDPSAQIPEGGATVSGTGNTIATFANITCLQSATSHTSGKWYFELTFVGTPDPNSADPIFGISAGPTYFDLYAGPGFGDPSNSIGWNGGDVQEIFYNNEWVNGGFPGATTSGAVISVCVDLDDNRFYLLSPEYIANFGANGWNGVPNTDPTAAPNAISFTAFPGGGATFIVIQCNTGMKVTLNSGQSAFVRSIPAGYAPWDAWIAPGVIHDTPTVSDRFASMGSAHLAISDNLGVMDRLSRGTSAGRQVHDMLSSSDQLGMSISYGFVLADSVSSEDSFAAISTATRAIADVLSLTEDLAPSAWASRSVQEVVGANEHLGIAANATFEVLDTAASQESYLAVGSGAHQVADALEIDDHLQIGSGQPLSLMDVLAPSEYLSVTILPFVLMLGDAADADERLGSSVSTTLALHDTADASEMFEPSFGLSMRDVLAPLDTLSFASMSVEVSLSDVMTAEDIVEAETAAIPSGVPDTLNPTESLAPRLVVGRSVQDQLSLVDGYAWFRPGVFDLALGEGVSISDAFARVAAPAMPLVDALALSDGCEITSAAASRLSDVLPTAERFVASINISLVDRLGIQDFLIPLSVRSMDRELFAPGLSREAVGADVDAVLAN